MAKLEIRQQELSYSSVEAYRALYTNLQFCGGDKKVIVVTSCIPNEGKSTTNLQLAKIWAESGKKVLLIDGDLRKSVLVGRFKVEGLVKGLTHYLSGQAELKDVICETNVEHLNVIVAGPVPPNPAELLGSEKFRETLRILREEYDYILIDTPPLGRVIDSAIVAEEADGVILVIESGVISYRFAQEVKKQMDKTGCPILGVILNKVDVTKQGYYGSYYGSYYGKYEQYGK